MFKIFYSWQSDLPSNKTRSFIGSCIDKAIENAQDIEAIEAMRDEATLGVTGAPDIVATLFSKIDECDLFIADISLCFTEDREKTKKAPNPNVMLELGYAVKTLTWNRVICICNTDYGEDFPFDLDHNRRVAYSLDAKNQEKVKSKISGIIYKNICDLRNAPQRFMPGLATHIIGTYDFEQKKVTGVLTPLSLAEKEAYILHNQELIEDSKRLVDEIREIRIIDITKEKERVFSDETPKGMDVTAQSFVLTEQNVSINVEEERESIRRWLGIEVDEEFFDCGNLKVRKHFLYGSETLLGSEKEQLKYDKLIELSYYLAQLEMRSQYIKTFSEMSYYPLAIQNISATDDQNIRIVVHIYNGEIVYPNKELICAELDGIQGCICRNKDENKGIGVIDELFLLEEDGIIHLEETTYGFPDYRPQMPVYIDGRLQSPPKDEQDYEDELQEYIAIPSGTGYYEFEVDTLRPKECKWLSRGLLVKPNAGFKIIYQIYSTHSSGDLSGEIL